MDQRKMESLLASLGYTWSWRNTGWIECLITNGVDTEYGQGYDEGTAFMDAATQLFLSSAARYCLEQVVGERLVPEPESVPAQGAKPVPPTVKPHQNGASREAKAVEVVKEVEVVADTDEHAPPVEEDAEESEAPTDGPRVGLDVRGKIEVKSAEERTIKDVASKTRLTPAQWMASLEYLDEYIDIHLADLGVSASEIQRAQFSYWVCKLREIQEANPSGTPVHAKSLDVWSKIAQAVREYWPGSIGVMGSNQTPDMVVKHFGNKVGRDEYPPMDWNEAADYVEGILDSILEDKTSHYGGDPTGWSDKSGFESHEHRSMRAFPCPDPDEELEACEMEMRRLVRDEKNMNESFISDLKDLNIRLREINRLIYRLRWCRPEVSDTRKWGVTYGRIRHFRQDLEKKFHDFKVVSRLKAKLPEWSRCVEALKDGFKPNKPYSTLLEYDPREVELSARGDELRQEMEGVTDWETAFNWFLKVLPEVGALEPIEIAGLLIPFREPFREWNETKKDAEFDTSQRKRLRKVCKYLLNQEQENKARASAEKMKRREVPKPPPSVWERFSEISQTTENLSFLAVSNRPEAEKAFKLQKHLQASRLDWEDACSPGKTDDLCNRVKSRTYDAVLVCTGWMSHKYTGKFFDACRESGTRFLSVNKGTPLQIMTQLKTLEA